MLGSTYQFNKSINRCDVVGKYLGLPNAGTMAYLWNPLSAFIPISLFARGR